MKLFSSNSSNPKPKKSTSQIAQIDLMRTSETGENITTTPAQNFEHLMSQSESAPRQSPEQQTNISLTSQNSILAIEK